MNIVIIGAGKVGEELCRRLSTDKHAVVLIEQDGRRLEQLINMTDITGVKGNGAIHTTQIEAGVETCDVFIAVTVNDETNIIAAITAKKLGAKYTVARVRDPEYSTQMSFVHESLGINLMINPEMQAAHDIARLIQLRSVLGIEQFNNGRVNIVEVRLEEGSSLNDRRIRDLQGIGKDFLICAIQRGEDVIIPTGETILRIGDHLHVTGTFDALNNLYKAAGCYKNRLKSALVVGAGRITRYLIPQLLKMKMRVKVIEVDEAHANNLAALFPGVEVICGDGTDQSFLREQQMVNHDAVISLTGIDEENMLLSLFASNQGVQKVVTKVNRTDLLKVIDAIDIGSAITPRRIIANVISRFVRELQNSEGSNIEMLYHMLDNQVEALMFKIKEDSQAIWKPLAELDLRDNIMVAFIIRDGHPVFPDGREMIRPGDRVTVVTTHHNFKDIDDILA